MKKIAIIVFAFFALIANVHAGDKATDGIWIDVRTVAEYNQGHKENAVNIPHTQIGWKIESITKDKDARIHLYCAAGVRAGKAKYTLEKMGYKNVTNEGGLSDVQ